MTARRRVRSCGVAAELVDIKALLGHESIATTQIYTNVGQERMEKVVARL
jgi:site-specific recombinase XerD